MGVFDEEYIRLIYRWIVIPWFQDHLDSFVWLFNNTKRRRSKSKILPQGRPPVIFFQHPHLHRLHDFKVRSCQFSMSQVIDIGKIKVTHSAR